MSVWNPDNIRDVAESVGITALQDEVVNALSSDVEYRLSQDVSNALRMLDVEPLYGYESTRPLRFGEASLGPGQPLFYVEDEEVDFEKLINAPLPKVPREMTFTAHWLALEGVQPSIPQNPLPQDTPANLLPSGPRANPFLPALSGADVSSANTTVKPLVKHVLSRELQQYFEKVTSALLDPSNDEYRVAALASLRSDPGLHQLVPYFVQWVAEKVTHNLRDVWILTQMCNLVDAILSNSSLFVDPYVASLVPPVLTCAISPLIGIGSTVPTTTQQAPMDHYPLRSTATALLGLIATKYEKSSSTLKPRLVRTFLKNFLDPRKPLPVHFGAIRGIAAIGGPECVRALIVPNLKEYSVLLSEGMDVESTTKGDAEMVVGAIVGALDALVGSGAAVMNGFASGDADAQKARLEEKVGDFLAARILSERRPQLVKAVLEN